MQGLLFWNRKNNTVQYLHFVHYISEKLSASGGAQDEWVGRIKMLMNSLKDLKQSVKQIKQNAEHVKEGQEEIKKQLQSHIERAIKDSANEIKKHQKEQQEEMLKKIKEMINNKSSWN